MNWFFDGFSGMGGVSLGIERAGCRVAVAVNHDDRAIKAHAANHPYTAHLNGDIRNVNIRKLAGRLIRKGIWRINLWWSAECTHFSNAKGGASRDADSRMLSEELIRYIREFEEYGIRIDYVFVENVKEFLGWTILLPKVLIEAKRLLHVESRYGEIQFEMFDAVAANDLVKKENLKNELDSLYVSLQQSGAYVMDDKSKITMLPDKTSKGQFYREWVDAICDMGYIYEYKVLNAADFGIWQTRERYFGIFVRSSLGIKPVFPKATHSKKKVSGLKSWVACKGMLDLSDLGEDILTGRKGKKPLVAATLARIKYGIEKFGSTNLIDNYTFGSRPKKTDDPIDTIMAKRDKYLFKASFVLPGNYGNQPIPTTEVLLTILASRHHHSLCVPFIAQSYSSSGNACQVSSCEHPLWTVTTSNKANLVVPFIVPQFGQSKATGLNEPLGCVTVNPKYSCNVAFLTKHYSAGRNVSSLDDPCGTCTTKDRFSLINCNLRPSIDNKIVLEIAPSFHKTSKGNWICGNWGSTRITNGYKVSRNIDKIHYRMLKVSELLQAQGFPVDYIVDPDSETRSKKFIGNAVQVEMARLIVKANVGISTLPALV